MSEIRVTTLKDTSGGNSSTTADIFSGRAKAWVNFNGVGTVAIRANFNVNSITDNGVGNFTVNFSTALSDSNFTFSGGGTDDNASPRYIYEQGTYGQYRTSSAFRFFCATPGVATGDAQGTYVEFFR